MLFIYGMKLMCVSILLFMYGNLCSTLYMSSTLAAPWRWLQFPTECKSIETNVQLVGNELVVVKIQA
jgi:hypothetical protein